jgi:glucose-6-phosphate isomerase
MSAGIDLDVGTMAWDAATCDGLRFGDVRDWFLDRDGADPDALVYEVHKPRSLPDSGLLASSTVIQPGDVAGEFYMTRGHYHALRDRTEVYVGLAGVGLLVLADESGGLRTEAMHRGAIRFIPGGWAHRVVNTGDVPLAFLAVYPADAGNDYEAIRVQGFPVRVFRGSGEPELRRSAAGA